MCLIQAGRHKGFKDTSQVMRFVNECSKNCNIGKRTSIA